MSEHTPKHEASASIENTSRHEAQVHHERAEKHRENIARGAEKNTVSHEDIKKDIETHAVSGKEYPATQAEHRQQASPLTRLDKERGFETIMHQVHNNMSRSERTFSKFIHQPAIEKTSEIAGKTIARPSGIIGATIAAFVGLLSVYGIAKFAGFGLSGSEVPILLCAGFAAGLFIEWFVKSVRAIIGKKPKTP